MSVEISLRGVSRHYGEQVALVGVDAVLPAGRLVAVVGSSGSGKTTLLRLIAGLEAPDAGEILFGEVAYSGRPEDRPTAMVFQSESLFPDLTVAQNIGFGVRTRGRRPELADEQVAIAMLRLGLTGLDDRYPDELSGGQARRVAIARAMVRQRNVLLLDEPFAGLDAPLVRALLRQLQVTQRRLGLTMVLVTHDQQHALLAADHVLVMDAGRVVQAGTPRSVFERPNSLFAAQFWGSSAFVDAQVEQIDESPAGRRAQVRLFGDLRSVPAHPQAVPGRPATVLLRPHTLRVERAPQAVTDDPWRRVSDELGVVEETHYYGDRVEYLVETEAGSLVAGGTLEAELIRPGTAVRLMLDEDRAWVLPLR